ncbi:MAG: acetate kinase [Cyanobacteriota bacterium]|nr:acetate kinase [Cyanobacteriota bacterium]
MTTPCVLVLNAGSSSIKAALIAVHHGSDGVSEQRLWHGQRTWQGPPAGGSAVELQLTIDGCLDGWLIEAIEPWLAALCLVGHRVVHGGERFQQATCIDAGVRQAIAEAAALAPLHNALALAVINWVEAWLIPRRPGLRQWACFDTAFHSSIDEIHFSYAIPAAWRARGLRRYGFHGINHQHIADTVTAIHREEGCSDSTLNQLRLVSAHLGAGCSLCAIAGGRSMGTTMGMTPLDGLVMASRSGSIDPGLLLHLLDEGLTPAELGDALNHRSGLVGLSGLSTDMRELRRAAAEGHSGAELAIAVFTERLLEGIAAMVAVLRGVDVIAVSGGIGENDQQLLHTMQRELSWLGSFRLLQVPANEEGHIARQCLEAQAPGPGSAG